jgi:signal transduction histidine kinase
MSSRAGLPQVRIVPDPHLRNVRSRRTANELVSHVSHELRTPLNVMLGFGQLLAREDLGVSARESLDQILIAGRHLLQVTDELLDLAQLESDDVALPVAPVDVALAVAEAVALCGPLAAEASLTLTAPEGPPSWALADPQRLLQVLLNLISNGLKFNRARGSVSVTVNRDDDKLRIEVSDTGVGIRRDQLDRLFKPFERLDAERSGAPGTGLGLAISKLLVDAMGGTIAARSTFGSGSTFSVSLRACPARLSDPLSA